MTFLVSAALVAVPTVLLAWLSSRTIETAGPKLLATIDGSGNARDYYPHVDDSRGDLPGMTRFGGVVRLAP